MTCLVALLIFLALIAFSVFILLTYWWLIIVVAAGALVLTLRTFHD